MSNIKQVKIAVDCRTNLLTLLANDLTDSIRSIESAYSEQVPTGTYVINELKRRPRTIEIVVYGEPKTNWFGMLWRTVFPVLETTLLVVEVDTETGAVDIKDYSEGLIKTLELHVDIGNLNHRRAVEVEERGKRKLLEGKQLLPLKLFMVVNPVFVGRQDIPGTHFAMDVQTPEQVLEAADNSYHQHVVLPYNELVISTLMSHSLYSQLFLVTALPEELSGEDNLASRYGVPAVQVKSFPADRGYTVDKAIDYVDSDK